MRKKIFFTLCMFGSIVGVAFAQNNDLETLKMHMKSFAPLSISQQKDIVTIVLDEVSVSKQIYENITASAVCAPMYLKSNNNFLSKIKEIEIINKSKSKGFILENPNQNCKDRAKEKGQVSKAVLYGNTRQY